METIISYDLRLGEGVGPINLGMNNQEIKSILGEPEYSSIDSLCNTDYYTAVGLHIDYEPKSNVCEAIEVIRSIELIYDEVNILEMSWEDMYRWLQENDPNLDIRENGYTVISYKLGISAGPRYSDYLEREVIGSIVVFSEGYWPSEEETKARVKKAVDAMPTGRELTKQLGLEKFFPDET
jgi:hypothetical protein